MSYESKLELQRADDDTLGVRQVVDESLAERQLRLLESIDQKLGKLVEAQTISCVGKTISLKSKAGVV